MMSPRIWIAVGSLAFAFLCGWLANGWRMGEKLADYQYEVQKAYAEGQEIARLATKAARKVEQERSAKTQAIAQAVEAQRRVRETEAQVITKEIVRYVQSPAATDCRLDYDWLRIHDLGASDPTSSGVSGAAPSAGEPDGPGGSLAKTDALVAITDNYARFHECRDKLDGFRKWAIDQGLSR